MEDISHKRLLIFIVAYNAESHIVGVLDRIPESVWSNRLAQCDVLIIDDASADDTCGAAARYAQHTSRRLIIQHNDINQGYGGNQKLGYQYAIDHRYDAVVLLHGDGQYNPELIPLLAAPVLENKADVVIGSRMMDKRQALKGGMPLYKFVGNIVLTRIQNLLLSVKLSEFHSGYRVYAISALRAVPFTLNANYFDFDTDILIQMIDTKQRFLEIGIPTFYGDEISHVNGIKYAVKILLATLFSRLQRWGLCHFAKFDYKSHQESKN